MVFRVFRVFLGVLGLLGFYGFGAQGLGFWGLVRSLWFSECSTQGDGHSHRFFFQLAH